MSYKQIKKMIPEMTEEEFEELFVTIEELTIKYSVDDKTNTIGKLDEHKGIHISSVYTHGAISISYAGQFSWLEHEGECNSYYFTGVSNNTVGSEIEIFEDFKSNPKEPSEEEEYLNSGAVLPNKWADGRALSKIDIEITLQVNLLPKVQEALRDYSCDVRNNAKGVIPPMNLSFLKGRFIEGDFYHSTIYSLIDMQEDGVKRGVIDKVYFKEYGDYPKRVEHPIFSLIGGK